MRLQRGTLFKQANTYLSAFRPERHLPMLLRPRRRCAATLLVLAVFCLSACSSNTQRSVESSPKKRNFIYRFFNPEYASGWSWWQKALFWAGPGH